MLPLLPPPLLLLAVLLLLLLLFLDVKYNGRHMWIQH